MTHMIVTLKDPPKGIIRTAHRWVVATGGADKFSFEIHEGGKAGRVGFPQPCHYSEKLRRDLCKLLGDEAAVRVENDLPIGQLSLMDLRPVSNYGD